MTSHPTSTFLYTSGVQVSNNVRHVQVGDSTTQIPEAAFAFCQQLVEVNLPDHLRVIGRRAFHQCCAIETIEIPSSVYEIRDRAMESCRSLEQIKLPEKLDWLGKGVFRRCICLQSMTVPPMITEIQRETFDGCRKLHSLNLPKGLEAIGDYAFAGCVSLTTVDIPSSVHEIGSSAFLSCKSLQAIQVPSGVNEIRHATFRNCSALMSVELPENIRVVESGAFMNCGKLRNICVSAIEPVGAYAFASCDELLEKFVDDLALTTELETRFDMNLDVHKVCYYQSHYTTSEALDALNVADGDQLHNGQVKIGDRFGMTPFHILALSMKPRVALFEALLAFRKDRFEMLRSRRDSWGHTALGYLCLRNENVGVLQDVIHLIIGWRIKALGLKRWRDDIACHIEALHPDDAYERMYETRRIYKRLAKYERLEATSLLELAAWKLQMLSCHVPETKKQRTAVMPDSSSPLHALDFRQSNRISCGAEIIISNVLAFYDGYF